jgi:hypothetical protein
VGFAGFVVTLGLINVDAFIVRENVGRLQETGKVDVAYLASLSSDAVPGLVRLAGEADPATRLELLPALACRLGQLESRAAETGLPSFHLSYTAALESLRGMEDDLAPYPVRWQPYSEGSRWGQWFVTVEGTEQTCRAEMEGF